MPQYKSLIPTEPARDAKLPCRNCMNCLFRKTTNNYHYCLNQLIDIKNPLKDLGCPYWSRAGKVDDCFKGETNHA